MLPSKLQLVKVTFLLTMLAMKANISVLSCYTPLVSRATVTLFIVNSAIGE